MVFEVSEDEKTRFGIVGNSDKSVLYFHNPFCLFKKHFSFLQRIHFITMCENYKSISAHDKVSHNDSMILYSFAIFLNFNLGYNSAKCNFCAWINRIWLPLVAQSKKKASEIFVLFCNFTVYSCNLYNNTSPNITPFNTVSV